MTWPGFISLMRLDSSRCLWEVASLAALGKAGCRIPLFCAEETQSKRMQTCSCCCFAPLACPLGLQRGGAVTSSPGGLSNMGDFQCAPQSRMQSVLHLAHMCQERARGARRSHGRPCHVTLWWHALYFLLCCREGLCVYAHLKWCIDAYLTLQGYKALLSSPWYLNLGAYADEAWATYYKVEPLEFNAPPEQMQLVIGGEVRLPFF